MSFIQRAILEDRVRTASNLLTEGLRNAELPSGEAREHLREALKSLALAQVSLKVKK